MYSCDICDATFTQKPQLEYHKAHNACKQCKYFCKYCEKGFTTDNSMYRHMKHNCKIKKQEDENKDKIYEELLLLELFNSQYVFFSILIKVTI
jgi:hypothetical protein